MFYIFWNLAGVGRKRAKLLGQDVYRTYLMCGVLTLGVWLLYPIAWAVSEGANLISSDSEAIFYGVLDLIAKPVFSVALILGHWNIDPARLGLTINYGDELVDPSAVREKAAQRDGVVDNSAVHNNATDTAVSTGTA
jgi:bacteriorhodopsin